MINIFLDDEREHPNDNFIIIRSFEHFVSHIVTVGCPNYISFDHDLGGEQTGYDCAKFLVQEDLNSSGNVIPKGFHFYVHSQNPIGKKNIEEFLYSYLAHKIIDNICKKYIRK